MAIVPFSCWTCESSSSIPNETFSEKASAATSVTHTTADVQFDTLPFGLPLSSGDLKRLENIIESLSDKLRKLSLDIHDHPELGFKEYYTAKLLAEFMEEHGFEVKRSICGLETAWSAEYVVNKHSNFSSEVPVIGFNSEMDALPSVGHACGHNLIAIAGVAAAIAVGYALRDTQTPGKVILLGTPAEEGGGGKIDLLERGAYKGMDACLMTHPSPWTSIVGTLAFLSLEAEFFGHTAHGAGAPWDGVNALDGAVLAYNAISMLRQQIHPDERIGIVFKGSENWASNVITGDASISINFRSATMKRLEELRPRVLNCIKGAATASGTLVEIREAKPTYELAQNSILAKEYEEYMHGRLGKHFVKPAPNLGSTDFGNVTYALPALHPSFGIPVAPGGANHTPEFTEAARTLEAHKEALASAKGLASVGWRVVTDDDFRRQARQEFENTVGKKSSTLLSIFK